MKCGNLKLDLGCGLKKPDGFIGLDIFNLPQLEYDASEYIQRDLRKEGLPFCDNSCAEIRAWHFLEHMTGDEMIYLMDECHRVLKHDGVMKVQVPDASRPSSWRPLHLQSFSLSYFDYLKFDDTKNNWEIASREVVRNNTCFNFILQPIK